MSRPKSTIASDSVALARETSREKVTNQRGDVLSAAVI